MFDVPSPLLTNPNPMPHLQIAKSTAAESHGMARYRSALQQAHQAAKARANAICAREPGVLSIYALGEEIAVIEQQAADAFARGEIDAYIALNAAALRLKLLIPAMR